MPTATEAQAPPRDWFSYIAQGTPDRMAVCDGTWKLVVTGGNVLEAAPGKKIPRVELFRLDRDPGETSNLAADQPERSAAMLERLREHRRLKIADIPDFLDGKNGFVAPKDWLILE